MALSEALKQTVAVTESLHFARQMAEALSATARITEGAHRTFRISEEVFRALRESTRSWEQLKPGVEFAMLARHEEEISRMLDKMGDLSRLMAEVPGLTRPLVASMPPSVRGPVDPSPSAPSRRTSGYVKRIRESINKEHLSEARRLVEEALHEDAHNEELLRLKQLLAPPSVRCLPVRDVDRSATVLLDSRGPLGHVTES
jgi:hypothetical protein